MHKFTITFSIKGNKRDIKKRTVQAEKLQYVIKYFVMKIRMQKVVNSCNKIQITWLT